MSRVKNLITIITNWIRSHAYLAIGITIGIILLLVIAGEIISRPEPETENVVKPKTISTYPIGTAAKIQVMGRVEESGSITIVAQTSGIVYSINVRQGQSINQGSNLVKLNTTYSGGNLQSLQLQLAQQQFQHSKDTIDTQKSILEQQRETIKLGDEQGDKLREINRQSLEDTRGQLSLNESILSTLDANLSDLEEATQSAQTDALILSTKQMRSQFLAATNQLRQAIRQTEYQAADDKPAAKIADIQKEISLKQLDLQQKSLELGVEVSRLNYQIAAVSASLTAPTSPIRGIVDRVYVKPFQAVQPGQPLVRISGETTQLDVIVSMAASVAQRISRSEPSIISIGSQNYEIIPQHVTLEPLEDSQYRVYYHLPLEASNQTFDGQFVSVNLPLGYASSGSTIPSIPVDSVYQLQNQAFVYLVNQDKVESRQIKLGEVFGGSVEVLEGLSTGDILITSRNVASGDQVATE